MCRPMLFCIGRDERSDEFSRLDILCPRGGTYNGHCLKMLSFFVSAWTRSLSTALFSTSQAITCPCLCSLGPPLRISLSNHSPEQIELFSPSLFQPTSPSLKQAQTLKSLQTGKPPSKDPSQSTPNRY